MNTTTYTQKNFEVTSKYWAKGGHERMYHTVSIAKGAYGVSNTVKALLEGANWYTDLKTNKLYRKTLERKAEVDACTKELTNFLKEKFSKKVEEVVEEVVSHRELTLEEVEDVGDVVNFERKLFGWDEIAELPKPAPDTRTYDEKFYSEEAANCMNPLAQHNENFLEEAIEKNYSTIRSYEYPLYLSSENFGFVKFENFEELKADMLKVGEYHNEKFENVSEAEEFLFKHYVLNGSYFINSELGIWKTINKLNKIAPFDVDESNDLVWACLSEMNNCEVFGKKFDMEDFILSQNLPEKKI